MFSFEKLEVYQRSTDFYDSVHVFLKQRNSLPSYLKNQLGRAALSIPLNIAEGSAKFSERDRWNFYIIARGSVFECAAIFRIMKREGEVDSDFEAKAVQSLDEISRMLFALIKNLEARLHSK